MKYLPLLLAAALSVGPLSSCAATNRQADGGFSVSSERKNASLNAEHFVLDNGLHVYLSKNTAEPRFRAEIVVNAGGKNDPADATGIAHYLEHMLFKGSRTFGTADFEKENALLQQITTLYDERFSTTDEARRAELDRQINELSVQASQYAIPGELDSLYSRLGAEGLNAYTSVEETVYLLDLPKNRLEQWAMIESNRFAQPVFRLFQSELETVYEEKNRSLDNKEDVLFEAVQRKLFDFHPYGTQTILGSVEHLKNPSLTKMYEFYNRYYVPNNMAIVISGDIDIPEAKRIITKYFSNWEKKPVEQPTFTEEAPITGVEEVTVDYKGEEKIMLAFRTVPYKHEDIEALRLVDMLLDSGQAGLIKNNLVNTQKLRAAGSFPYIKEDYSEQYLHAVLKEGQSKEEARNLLLEQLEKIKSGDFDEELLKGIVLDYEISQKRQLESNTGRASLMKEAFLNNVSLSHVLSQPERLKKIGKAEIVRVANKYFGNDYVFGYRQDKEAVFPKITKPELKGVTLNSNRRSPFVQQVESIPAEPIEPKWVNYNQDFKAKSYAPGVVYYHVKNPVNDLFNFSISYEFGGKHYKNFCYVMDELDFAGVEGMTAEQVKNEFFKMGVTADFSCSDYGFAMNLSGLDAQFEKALKLGEQVLWNARLNEERFKAKIDNVINTRADQKKDLTTLRGALSQFIRYGEDSTYLDRPTNEELKRISVTEYPRMISELAKQNFKIYYVGQLPMDKVEDTVRKYHYPAEINVPLLEPREKPALDVMERHNKPVKIYFLDYKGAQAHINALIPGQETDPALTLVNSYYNEYLDGGMGAILFQEVREARALAYSTWGRYFFGEKLGDEDQFYGYIGTQADKTVDALSLFIDLLKNTPESGTHFERARQALENAYRTGYVNFRSVVPSVLAWGELGYASDPRPERFENLDEIELTDLKNYMQNKISSKNMTFMIVGDKNIINMEGLRKLGEVEEISIDQLFRD